MGCRSGLSNSLQTYPVLNPLEFVNVTLYGKKDFTDMKLKTLRWRDYPWALDVMTSILVRANYEESDSCFLMSDC